VRLRPESEQLIQLISMKKIALLTLATISLGQTFAQDFPGYRTGNYTGVNGVFFNPANIAGSPYRFDINLVSVSTLEGNDHFSYKLKDMSQTFKGDSAKSQLFGKNAGPSSGTMNVDFHGPSVMFNTGKKTSFALTTRARVFASIVDVDGKLFNKISEDFNSSDPNLPYTISSSQNMRVAINAWSEFGASIGRILYDQGPHMIKGGITLKYLSGAGNGYVNINQFNGKLDKDLVAQDAYLSNTTGHIGVGFGGINISNIKAEDLTKKHGSGMGGDIGVIYEYRPDAGTKNKTPSYKFKFGLSLLDIGKIKYKKDALRSGDYDINITGNERFYMNQLNGVALNDYNTFLSSKPQYFTPSSSNINTDYSVSLPTSLQIDADYHVEKGFFVSLASQVSLSNNKTKVYNNQTYSGVTLTPRFETKIFGFYLPLNYNSLSKFNAGASFRFGPVFIGSGSIVSALVSRSRQVDFHFGVRFGGLK
jgi:hypothetical protein